MKVAVTGRPGVGKTALVSHASRGDWIGELPETLGTAVMRVEREDGRAYDLWDVGARHAARHPDAVDAQLAGADVLVHVFSFADAASLRSAPEYLERVRARAGCPVVLVGAKRDAIAAAQISTEDARETAARCGAPLVFVDSPPLETCEDKEDRDKDDAVAALFRAIDVTMGVDG